MQNTSNQGRSRIVKFSHIIQSFPLSPSLFLDRCKIPLCWPIDIAAKGRDLLIDDGEYRQKQQGERKFEVEELTTIIPTDPLLHILQCYAAAHNPCIFSRQEGWMLSSPRPSSFSPPTKAIATDMNEERGMRSLN